MTWKSTAVVSGVGLLATWLASNPPANSPSSTEVVRSQTAAAGADIQREAERLGAKVRAQVEYSRPSRNPFRFGERTAPRDRPSGTPEAQPLMSKAVEEPVRIKLSGIAIDLVDGHEQRTAILNTPTGLTFAREGDQVADVFRVGRIADDAVDLLRADGSIVTIR
jgi:hypothetical protein